MGARFAGSQRLGDRRRRRLAVESEDLPGAVEGSSRLSGPAGSARVGHGAHVDEPSGAGRGPLGAPLSALIPPQWWKYLIGATGCLAIAGGLVAAGIGASARSHNAGFGIVRLFAFPEARIATWFSSLLLMVSSQLALVIWWARSQSLKDFDGRYRLWIRVASLWMAVSLGTATDAARVLEEAFTHIFGSTAVGHSFLGWLIPAAALGLWVIWAVAGEMRGCRLSRWLLWTGAACHMLAAGLRIAGPAEVTEATRELLVGTSLLAAHVSIFLSMWIHARYVVHCTSEPAAGPQIRWRIPRPHFRLPAIRMPGAARRKESSPAIETATPNRAPAAAETTPTVESRAVEKPSRPPPPVMPIELSDLADGVPLARSAECENAGSVSDGSEDPAKPDLRGLSKKQRRRVLQEIRERERAAGG